MIAAPLQKIYCHNCLKELFFKGFDCSCEGRKKVLVYNGQYVDYSSIHFKLEAGNPTLFDFHVTIDDLIRGQKIKAAFQEYIPFTAIENLNKCKLITVNPNIRYENKVGE